MIYPIAVITRIAHSFNYRAATSISCPPHGLIVKTDPKNELAKPPARRGFSAYASESDIHKSSIFNSGYPGRVKHSREVKHA